MMSTRNFYNAMTPGSSLTSDMMIGKSAYKQIQDSEINSRSLNKTCHNLQTSEIIFSCLKISWTIFGLVNLSQVDETNCSYLKNANKLPVQGGTLLNSINEQVPIFKDDPNMQ